MSLGICSEVRLAEPVYFGSPDRPRFGWLHRAPPGAAMRAEGMVVCSPFGSEVLSVHRSLRHFAKAASALGLPTLRFDYDGAGDSAGTDRDPGRWAAWLRSVHDAVDELRRLTGVHRVHLFGLRLGATLAALAAADREDIAGLVAIVPVVSGKQWLRELDALQIAMRSQAPPPGVDVETGIYESVGFVMTPETRASIASVDLLALAVKPVADVLLVTRADFAPNQRWADRLRVLGTKVDHRLLPGYTEMMLDAHEAIVPVGMIEAMCGWLDERSSRCGHASAPNASSPLASATVTVAPGVGETAVFLDETRTLFGIVSAPARGPRPTRAVLLLNSGANPHIGPGRLYVHFARRWAARGYLVLRVDLSGLGDSAPRPGEPEDAVYSPWAIRDVKESVTYLHDRWGAASFSAVGLCSGAYHGLRAAVAGVPLTGVIVINPLVFFWKQGMSLSLPQYQVAQSTAQYRRSLFQLDKWKKLLTGKVDLAEFAQVVVRRVASIAGGWVRSVARRAGRPLAEDLGAELEGLSRRNVSVAFVFAVGNPGEDVLRVQAGSSLRRLVRRNRIRIHRIHGPNHTFTQVWSHAVVTETLDGELDIR